MAGDRASGAADREEQGRPWGDHQAGGRQIARGGPLAPAHEWERRGQLQQTAAATTHERTQASQNRPPTGGRSAGRPARQGQPITGRQPQPAHQHRRSRQHKTRPKAPKATKPEIKPNAPARTHTRAKDYRPPARRYWRPGGQLLRVRKPKIFLGKGSKNRFLGGWPGKRMGVKIATQSEKMGAERRGTRDSGSRRKSGGRKKTQKSTV